MITRWGLEVLARRLSRRALLRATAVASGTALAAPLLNLRFGYHLMRALAAELGQADIPHPIDLLNQAVTLEYLEARMHVEAQASGALAPLGWVADAAASFAQQEAQHAQALAEAVRGMGGEPATPLDTYRFPPFDDTRKTVEYLASIEEMGLGAYLAVVPMLLGQGVLAPMLSILNTEAAHTAIMRQAADQPPAPGAFAISMPLDKVEIETRRITGR